MEGGVFSTFSPVTPVRWIPSCALPLCMSVPLFLPKRSFMRLLPRPTVFFDFGITIFAIYSDNLLTVYFCLEFFLVV
jgi:hypothetical protein